MVDGSGSGQDRDPPIEEILKAARIQLGMEVSFVAQFSHGRRVFRYIDCAEGRSIIKVGDDSPLEESYCHWVVEGQLPQLIRDPSEHQLATGLAATRAVPVGAHLSAPIRLRDGSVYGTFCCFSTSPDPTLTARDLTTLQAFAQIAANLIQQELDRAGEFAGKAARIRSMLARRAFDIVFQPAIRIETPRVEFVEALARFRSEPYKSPDRWFEDAHQVGLGVALEAMTVRAALRHLAVLPNDTPISVNISPEALISNDLLAELVAAPLDRVIVEVTEHRVVKDYAAILRAIDPLRKRGLRLAVDDAGAGHSSLRHILQIRPDIIKLDMSLARGIHRDPVRRALAAALAHFTTTIGCHLVAEGVESPAELATLRELGVHSVQGRLVATPSRLSELDLSPAAAA